MKMTRIGVISGILMFALLGPLWAVDGTITGITVTPANPSINQAITVTVNGTITPGKKCQILFLKGDGTPQSQVGHATSFPFTFGGQAYPLYVYSKAGTYTIKVYCGNANCTGQAQATVTVKSKLAGIPKGPSLPVGANPCPPGWRKKSGEANGAFSCVPNKPTKIQCPPGTAYYENECSVGCQVVPN
ncbi:MAG: hypothetical protein EHM45_14885 [Desulfobacteraceae bacterium]|nr:MAG: hypothetical protein EHM45_14885 [Desulfobacteraceae bacterium]